MKIREPGGNEISESIRTIIMHQNAEDMDAKTEELLCAASRRQHLISGIIPNLESDIIVLCDRFVDSFVAYQGASRKIGVDDILQINSFAVGTLKPDLTIYFDINQKDGMARINKNRSNEVNRLDRQTLDFYYDVRNEYKNIQKK